MRDKFDALIDRGAIGSEWYSRSGEWINRTTGGRPERIHRTAGSLGRTSSQADPSANLGFHLQAQNALNRTGQTPPIVHTGEQARELQRSWKKTGRSSKVRKPAFSHRAWTR